MATQEDLVVRPVFGVDIIRNPFLQPQECWQAVELRGVRFKKAVHYHYKGLKGFDGYIGHLYLFNKESAHLQFTF
jgi:hypothetical protein